MEIRSKLNSILIMEFFPEEVIKTVGNAKEKAVESAFQLTEMV